MLNFFGGLFLCLSICPGPFIESVSCISSFLPLLALVLRFFFANLLSSAYATLSFKLLFAFCGNSIFIWSKISISVSAALFVFTDLRVSTIGATIFSQPVCWALNTNYHYYLFILRSPATCQSMLAPNSLISLLEWSSICDARVVLAETFVQALQLLTLSASRRPCGFGREASCWYFVSDIGVRGVMCHGPGITRW